VGLLVAVVVVVVVVVGGGKKAFWDPVEVGGRGVRGERKYDGADTVGIKWWW